MSYKIKTKKSLVQWCDEQVAAGKEIGIGWEGGGDSGWCYFMIDGKQVSDGQTTEEMEQLLDLMDDELDYGSWAGEFSAAGEAIYSSEEKAFVGIDNYGEDDTEYWECSIPIRIPKYLWFDSVEYNFEDDEVRAQFAFKIRNGFLIEEHEKVATEIESYLEEKVNAEVNLFIAKSDAEFRSIWQNDTINRDQFTEDGDFLVYTLEELSMGTTTSEEKDIYLQLEIDDDHDAE
jgi:hypothetical protein